MTRPTPKFIDLVSEAAARELEAAGTAEPEPVTDPVREPVTEPDTEPVGAPEDWAGVVTLVKVEVTTAAVEGGYDVS